MSKMTLEERAADCIDFLDQDGLNFREATENALEHLRAAVEAEREESGKQIRALHHRLAECGEMRHRLQMRLAELQGLK